MDDALRAALEKFGLRRLAESGDVVYAVDSELKLCFVNGTYKELANACRDGAVLDEYPLGSSIVEGIAPPLREHFTDLFEGAMGGRDPVAADYHCHTPTEERLFRCMIYPLDGEGLLMIHGPLSSRPWPPSELDELRDEAALLPMCAGCRRVRAPDGKWSHVPQLLAESPPRATHGLCDACLGFYLHG